MSKFTLSEIIDSAVSPFDKHCGGYMNPPNQGVGYIATLKLSIGKTCKGIMDPGLAGIAAYDQAEREDAYIGQINMMTASSFTGPMGAIWGYDLALADSLRDPRSQVGTATRHDGTNIPVWSVDPLLNATKRLFGTEGARRFPPMPGAMVICANKDVTVEGPTDVWCAIALAIAEDRTSSASLFVEDASDTAHAGVPPIDVRAVTDCVISCGRNNSTLYREIFLGVRTLTGVRAGEVACALTCAPYVTLPMAAVPNGTSPSHLQSLSITDWEMALGLTPLPTSAK